MATYAKVPRLTKERNKNMEPSFRRLAELLRNSGTGGVLRCTILVGDKSLFWTLELQRRECRLHRGAAKAPNLEIITQQATWLEIAEGRLSPLDAFIQGRMRILGDTELGSRLLGHVAEGDGATSLCNG